MQSILPVAYIRKSQEADDRQALSLPAQRREVLALAQRQNLVISGEPIEEARTAKTPGRPEFNRMLELIRKKKANAIVVWHPDRLARNPLDGGLIMWLLGEGAIKQIVTPGRIYTGSSDDKLMLSIIFGMATKYSDDLSANVRRGNQEALSRGLWPGYPKFGYVRDGYSKMLLPDPERFPIIQELWQLLLGGTPISEILTLARERHDLRSPRFGRNGGKHLSRTRIYIMFRDPFYAGVMVRAGKRFPGKHQPAVTPREFARAQDILDGRSTKAPRPKSLFFPYRGILTCGECDGSVTAKITTNRHGTSYRHYYCARRKGLRLVCRQGVMQEEDIESQLVEAARSLVPPKAWIKTAIEAAEGLADAEGLTNGNHRDRIETEIDEIDRRTESLRRYLVDGVISPEDYGRDHEKMLLERQRLSTKLNQQGFIESMLEPLKSTFSLLELAPKILNEATGIEKRDLVNLLFLNPRIKDKKLLILAKKPFSIYPELSGRPSKRRWRIDVGTLLREDDEEFRNFVNRCQSFLAQTLSKYNLDK